MMQDFNLSLSHPAMATNRSVSAGDKLSNPSSGGWEKALSSYPCKGLSWVTSCEAQSGDCGGGGGAQSWWCFYIFYILRCFFWERETGEAGKIRLDLKKCNESWSIGCGHLARETLAIKWRGLWDKMLVWNVSHLTPPPKLPISHLQAEIDEQVNILQH